MRLFRAAPAWAEIGFVRVCGSQSENIVSAGWNGHYGGNAFKNRLNVSESRAPGMSRYLHEISVINGQRKDLAGSS
jgi:hypothetical protein